MEALSKKEIEALRFTACGFSSKYIASKLYISKSAVDKRLISAKLKLGAKNLVNAIYIASKIGLLCLVAIQINDDARRCQLRHQTVSRRVEQYIGGV